MNMNTDTNPLYKISIDLSNGDDLFQSTADFSNHMVDFHNNIQKWKLIEYLLYFVHCKFPQVRKVYAIVSQ